MSTSKGNCIRSRPQKHQNKTAFRNDLHDTSKKTKIINSLDISHVCKRCKDVIGWKIKYKKYKPLTAPAKCVGCEQKTVKHAYHVMCTKCAKEKNVCAKCCTPVEKVEQTEDLTDQTSNTDLQAILKSLPERKRRTIIRHMNKQENGVNMKNEEILSKIGDINFDDDDDSDLDDFLADNDEDQ